MTTNSRSLRSLTTALSSAWTALSGDLRRLILIGFVEITAVNFYASLLMPYYRSLGYGSEVAGALTSVLQVVGALVAVGAGFMADNLGRKKLYVAGQLFRCAAVGLLMVTRSYAGLVLISAVRGLASVQTPAQSAIFASHTRRENRATLYGLYQTAAQAASVVAPLLAGFLADRFGVMASFGTGLLLACVAVAIAVPLKDGTQTDPAAKEARAATPVAEVVAPARETVGKRISRMFKENRPVTLSALLASSLTNGLANGATNILLPFMIMDRFSSAYATVSASQAVGAMGTMLVLLIGGRIADLRGRRGVVLVSGAIFPLLMVGIFAVNALWQLLAILFLITMAGNISSPAVSAVYMEAVGDKDRATFAGLQMSLQNTGMALGSIAAGIGYKFSSFWSWVAVIILFSLQLPLYALAIPRERGK